MQSIEFQILIIADFNYNFHAFAFICSVECVQSLSECKLTCNQWLQIYFF